MAVRTVLLLCTAIAVLVAEPVVAQEAYLSVDGGLLVNLDSDRFSQKGPGVSGRLRAGLKLGSRPSHVGLHALVGWAYAEEEARNDQCSYNAPQFGAGALFSVDQWFVTGDLIMGEGGCTAQELELIPAVSVGARFGRIQGALELSKQDFYGVWLTLRFGLFLVG